MTYLEAFLCLNYGYWYPDVSYGIANISIDDNDLGIHQNKRFALARSRFINLFFEQEHVPLLSLLYGVGLMVWVAMAAAAIFLLKKQRRFASPMLLLAGIWLPMLFSPVFCEYRYVFPMLITTPLCLGVALSVQNKRKAADKPPENAAESAAICIKPVE